MAKLGDYKFHLSTQMAGLMAQIDTGNGGCPYESPSNKGPVSYTHLDVGTAADEKVAVYTAGCFDIGKVTVSASYTITESDKDNLRMRGIVFKAAAAAN